MSRYLIATGIYPPKIGGPAQYAKNLKGSLEKMGHAVTVKTFDIEEKLPTGLRHAWFFIKIIPSIISSDTAFIFDTFSVGLPTVCACFLFGKQSIIRTGGDFLWEGYVERTQKKVLLRTFYDTEQRFFTLKERIIFLLTRWTLNHATTIIFSTEWQRDIFLKPYRMKVENVRIVENYYGPKETNHVTVSSNLFVASTRNLVWKNIDVLRSAFEDVQKNFPKAELFTDNLPFDRFMEKIKQARAVVLVSLGDISPNMILDAIRLNIPFICTREVGIYDRIKDAGIFIDPLDQREITRAIDTFLTDVGYTAALEKVRAFSFVHTWDDIAREFVAITDAHS